MCFSPKPIRGWRKEGGGEEVLNKLPESFSCSAWNPNLLTQANISFKSWPDGFLITVHLVCVLSDQIHALILLKWSPGWHSRGHRRLTWGPTNRITPPQHLPLLNPPVLMNQWWLKFNVLYANICIALVLSETASAHSGRFTPAQWYKREEGRIS